MEPRFLSYGFAAQPWLGVCWTLETSFQRARQEETLGRTEPGSSGPHKPMGWWNSVAKVTRTPQANKPLKRSNYCVKTALRHCAEEVRSDKRFRLKHLAESVDDNYCPLQSCRGGRKPKQPRSLKSRLKRQVVFGLRISGFFRPSFLRPSDFEQGPLFATGSNQRHFKLDFHLAHL